ncbi:MAG TPA: hypothetical protein DEF78_19315 [Sphingobacterium sp.]|nr:hypothetical protein [Sphingobacterium sp.]
MESYNYFFQKFPTKLFKKALVYKFFRINPSVFTNYFNYGAVSSPIKGYIGTQGDRIPAFGERKVYATVKFIFQHPVIQIGSILFDSIEIIKHLYQE